MANKKSGGNKKSTSSRSSSRSGTTAQKRAQREAVKFAKSHKKGVAIFVSIVIIILIAAVLIVYFCFPHLWDRALAEYLEYTKLYYGDSKDDDPAGTEGVKSDPVPEGNLASITTADFSIHFLELGNKYAGDCTLIKCGDTEVLIDAGSRSNSAATISAYIDQYCTDNTLEYVVATHAHQDHIAGFVGNSTGGGRNGVLYKYDVGTLIQFSRHNSTSTVYKNYEAAVTYAANNGAEVYTALECWNGGNATEGARRSFDLSAEQDGSLTLNVLFNYYYEHDTDDENDYSVCVLLTHTAADKTQTHYLFTGDLEGKGEEYLVQYNNLPKVELFKGGHHGSKTSSTEKLLKLIQPKNVAVCCCAGSTEYTSNANNTFPTQAFIDRISAYTENVYVTSLCIDYKAGTFTSMNGNIVFYVSGKEMSLWCSNGNTKLKDTQWFKDNRTGWTAA
ncbi:MAG: MBL fold metallo-hydrolase, partial [Clostridia bacterium]|nr:MBL fold metallo-hydrolase [Clostridia bacterium]